MCLNVSGGMAAHFSSRAVDRAVMWGVGVWSEVGVLIEPIGILWDSGKEPGLASPCLEHFCPQIITL
jgi:hypothetical protein